MRQPFTRDALVEQLLTVGVEPGMTLVVHSSLSACGYVVGGAPAVVLALEAVLGPAGTLAMPTYTADLTDPEAWEDPPVPESWHQVIRETMTPFYPDLTPARGMGIIPETFRKQAGSQRSDHPFVSWAARGPNAQQITANHSIDMSSGEGSPLARLYDLDARVLLLGVGYDRNSSFHLAEYRNRFAPRKRCRRGGPFRTPDGDSTWGHYDDIYLYEADFPKIGEAFEQRCDVRRGNIGEAASRLFSQRQAVDFAVAWMNENRSLD